MADNPALRAAAAAGTLLPIFILDDADAGSWSAGAASRAWLHHSLKALNRSLNGRLRLFNGNAAGIIGDLAAKLPVKAVYWNRCYEPWRMRRDGEIKARLLAKAVEARSFNGSLLWEPWEIGKKDGSPYRVFTPFYQKGCLAAAPPRAPRPMPEAIDYSNAKPPGACKLDALALLPVTDWHRDLLAHWCIGEAGAESRLAEFCESALSDYRRGRDYPASEASSRLSPHIRFGEISPHRVWHRVESDMHRQDGDSAAHYLRELGWREFSYHLLYHFPDLPERNFNPRFDAFAWRSDTQGLRRWQRGLTGYPIVDAGMRELWQTGYMHNRVRMIAASFLIKNMLIDWREGERWFWDCLVDADLANNSASWQWCAGSGADAAPYFRIFNPVLQSQKFDPNADYILRYCPELGGLPKKLRHQPWLASAAQLAEAGIELGVDYPQPMLDLKLTRERALTSL